LQGSAAQPEIAVRSIRFARRRRVSRRQKNRAHATFAEHAKQNVRTDSSTRQRNFSRSFVHWRLQVCECSISMFQQSSDGGSKFLVVKAGFVYECPPPRPVQF
jgi:hypothetical protein